MKSALLVINMQNNYCIYCDNYTDTVNSINSSNSNNITNSLTIIPLINSIRDLFDYVIFVKDWYPKTHKNILNNKIKIQCIQNTDGAKLNSGLIVNDYDFIINKCTLELYDSDSAFYNAKEIDKESNLNNIIKENGITNIYICGMLPEQNIFATVLDAIRFKHKITIFKDLCVGLNKNKIEKSYQYLNKLNVDIINSTQLTELVEP